MSLPPIEFEDSYCGIIHWAYWDMTSCPRFDVFKYIGTRKSMLVFQAVKRGYMFFASEQEVEKLINTRILRPFCIPGGKTINGKI